MVKLVRERCSVLEHHYICLQAFIVLKVVLPVHGAQNTLSQLWHIGTDTGTLALVHTKGGVKMLQNEQLIAFYKRQIVRFIV